MNPKSIRSWCMMQPRPKSIRVHCFDDRIQELKPPGKGQNWAQQAKTIAALQPTLLEAYDGAGNLLRAYRMELDDADSDDDTTGPINPEMVVPTALAGDSESLRLTHFANLLFRSQQFATQVAFDKMVMLFEISEQRSQSIEARLERTEAHLRRVLQSQVEDAFDQAAQIVETQGTAQPQVKDQMMEMFVRSFMQGHMSRPQPSPAANGSSNGKPNGGKS